MKTENISKILGCLALWASLMVEAGAVTPPVIRSTGYNGGHSNVVHYSVRPWMNTNTVQLTVEVWIYCHDLDGSQALVARHYSTNLFFGLSGSRLRFYRSGGTFAESDGTVAVRRWTHVAATYDGSFVRFYINGVNSGTKSLANAGNNSTNGLSLGGQFHVLNLADVFAGGHAFNGYLDEVRLWSVVRSASAIAANMGNEIRSGTGLLATFGYGGSQNDIRSESGTTAGTPVAERLSGFGILPGNLCIPRTRALLRVDGNIDLFNEYRGAETIVLRSRNSTHPDKPAYLMVSTNATNHHLFVGVPSMDQVVSPVPVTQVMCDANPFNGTGLAIGDWECRMDQESFQGGRIYGTNPPLFTVPQWLSWGQSTSNWQAVTAVAFEFDQNYEFRIHGRHLNNFTNPVGLLVRYYDFDPAGDQLIAPRSGVTNLPATYARADWCGQADTDLIEVTISGVVSNVTLAANQSGWRVSLISGATEVGGQFVRSVDVSAGGSFTITGNIAKELPFHLRLEDRTDYTYLPPEFYGSGRVPTSTSANRTLTYAPCFDFVCTPRNVRFRVQSPPGPVSVTGMNPTTGSPEIVLRESPRKALPGTIVTLTGVNLHTSFAVYLSKCNVIPPSPAFCTLGVDLFPVTILSNNAARTELTVQLPADDPQFSGSFRWVLEDRWIGHPGWSQWIYGPSGFIVDRNVYPYPMLHGFEFINRDDGPSVEEFEACYGESIFNIFRIREPWYGIWAIVYFAWMDGTKGSCYGMAGTSRLLQDGSLPVGTFDVPGGDGVHGVHFANGYLGEIPCEIGGELCPNRPGQWTGFDLFQPFRPRNLWARITSLAGAQTSAEALASWLSQLHRPVAFGPRRGFAAGDPVAVLNRLRIDPTEYTLCVQKRDFGDGHCITPYAVVDGMGLAADALTPIAAANSSLIRIYDNNWPGDERFIEVNRVDNTFRYHSETRAGIYDGPGLFSVPMSVYRGPRHAPDPFFLGRYGVEFLRLLTTGASTASITDAAGGRVGWSPTGFTNGYEGALPFNPFGLLLDGTNHFDTTMLFLPSSNAPAVGGFFSGGSNVMVYGGMGWSDIAFGFNAPNSGVSNSIDGILIGQNEGLRAMGLRAGAPVSAFGAMVSSRDDHGQSRVYVLDAGTDPLTPDLVLNRDGFKSLRIRNRSAAPFGFRLNIAGTDLNTGGFERAYEFYTQPPNSTLTLLLPENPGIRSITRELDTNNDGIPDKTEEVPANGQLRIGKEAGLLALRWRQAGHGETLECASNLTAKVWSPVGAAVTTEGPDRVARVSPTGAAQFYRVKPIASNCLSLSAFTLGTRPNPWETNGFKFEALSAFGAMLSQNSIVNRGGFTGLDVVHTVRVHPMGDCQVIHLDIFQTSGYVTFEAVGALGVIVGRQTLVGPGTGPQRVTLRSFRGGIHYVRVISPNALCVILSVCCDSPQLPVRTESHCLSFSNATVGQFSSPYPFDDVTITASPGPVVIGPVSGLSGNWLKLSGQIELKLLPPTAPCDLVTLRLRDFEGVVTATAYDAGGAVIATAGPPPALAAPQDLAVSGSGITRVVLSSTSDKAFLQDVCCHRAGAP
jgi:hypothetical protein